MRTCREQNNQLKEDVMYTKRHEVEPQQGYDRKSRWVFESRRRHARC
jgi:hypothetical protein